MAMKLLIQGGDGGRGYQSRGDSLINELADGVSLSTIWTEINDAVSLVNEQRSALASLLSFRTTSAADAVPQNIGGEHFEEATEYGIPRGIGHPDYLKLGYGWKDWDVASRFTWKALRAMDSRQVQNAVSRILDADHRLVSMSILKTLFNNVPSINDYGHTVYPLYNNDSMIPPPYLGQTFGSANHYLTTANTTLDSLEVEQSIKLIRRFGYGTTNNSRFLLLANPVDIEACGMTTWRAGVAYDTGKIPKFDFITGPNAPAYLSSETLHGPTPPADYNGLPVTGSYGSALLIESYLIPAGYIAMVASGGPNSDLNPIGFREHSNDAYNGLRVIPGHWQGYPLLEHFYARGFGTGVRHRGAAICVQITTNNTYTPPTIQV